MAIDTVLEGQQGLPWSDGNEINQKRFQVRIKGIHASGDAFSQGELAIKYFNSSGDVKRFITACRDTFRNQGYNFILPEVSRLINGVYVRPKSNS